MKLTQKQLRALIVEAITEHKKGEGFTETIGQAVGAAIADKLGESQEVVELAAHHTMMSLGSAAIPGPGEDIQAFADECVDKVIDEIRDQVHSICFYVIQRMVGRAE